MAKARFGWENRFLTGVISASAQTSALPATNLQTKGGGASEALETPLGVTDLRLTLDAGAVVSWRDFLLARTNLTEAAKVRWQLHTSPPVSAVALPTDTDAGASKGSFTTRIGKTIGARGTLTATTYQNSSTSQSYVQANVQLQADVLYRVRVWARLVSGTTTGGSIISVSYNNGSGTARASAALSLVTTTGAYFEVTFLSKAAGTFPAYFFTGNAGTGQVALDDATLEVVPQAASGQIAGVVRGFGQLAYSLPTEVTARYLTCDISDPNNSDRFLSIALAYAGPTWELGINLAPDTARAPERRQISRENRAGGIRREPQFYRRGMALSHRSALDDEIWTQLDALERAAWGDANILLLPDADSPQRNREAIFGPMQFQGSFTYPYGTFERVAWSARIDERL